MNTNLAMMGVALLLFSGVVAAQEDPDAFCSSVASLAAEIASSHQSGVPLDTMLKQIEVSGVDDANKAAFRKIAVSIYSGPRYRTEENQADFIARTRDEIHVQCLREAGE
jgi:hypothetical protein